MRQILYVNEEGVRIHFGEYFWRDAIDLSVYDHRAFQMYRAGGYTGKVWRLHERESKTLVGQI